MFFYRYTGATISTLHAEGTTTRQAFFARATVGAAAALLLTQQQPANAAKYGGFGAGSPEVLDPASAEINQDVLTSAAVQKALSEIKTYQASVQRMRNTLTADAQANLKRSIAQELDASRLRTSFNALNAAFEEDTQRGTDRLIRAILQDVAELESANAVKDGVQRSDRRLEIMNGKLAKLDRAFSDLLAFAK
jgi:hypothetical protein